MISIGKLEEKASTLEQHGICRFNEGTVSCPWITFNRACIEAGHIFDGLFMMQDWGLANENEPLVDAVTLIKIALSSTDKIGDRTIDNLLAVDRWRAVITENRWIVANAVWGLRSKHKKCGYLGNKLHKAAFGVWSRLVVELAARRGVMFKLVVAGEWAVFDSEFKRTDDGTLPLKDYLKLWSAWSEPKADPDRFSQVVGTVLHCSHPATWNYLRLQDGPPQ